jgi:hypothetical protein
MRTARQLSDISRQLDKLEIALIVRDPGTSMSAEAYDGLRRQIIAAVQERTAHLVQLAMLDEALREAKDIDTLRALVDEWLAVAGLVRVEDPKKEALFEIVSGKGSGRSVVAPAYVDASNSRIIRQGRVSAFEEREPPAISATDGGEPRVGEQQ